MKYIHSIAQLFLFWLLPVLLLLPMRVDAQDSLAERIMVGAHYYLWYPEHLKSGNYARAKLVPPQEPQLGIYESNSISVVEQHISWASQHGIDFFTLDFWPNNPQYHSRIDSSFLKAKNIGDIKFCVFYETQDLRWVPRWGATVFTEKAVSRFLLDIENFSKRWFNHPSYLRVNGRPVVVLYLTRTYAKYYERAIKEARKVAKKYGHDVYFIADEIFWDVTEERKSKDSFRFKRTEPQVNRIKLFDALTSYNLYTRRYKRHWSYDGQRQFLKDNLKLYNKYVDAAPKNMPVIPTILPGYNDLAVPGRRGHVMPRAEKKGGDMSGFLKMGIEELAKPMLSKSNNMFFITSWNEWNEDTNIEPVKTAPPTNVDSSENGSKFTQGFDFYGYGTAHLETIRNQVIAAYGFAKDSKGNPLSGLEILAYREGVPVAKSTSHSDGLFTLSRLRLPPGNYRVGTSPDHSHPLEVLENQAIRLPDITSSQPENQ